MKILMVNKFYYIKGGSESYYFLLKQLLESKGHTVIEFSMEDERNFDSAYNDYFVKNVNYNSTNGIKAKFKIVGKIIYSFEAKKKFEQLIKDTKPDLIHLHIFQHQLSPSILDVIKKYQIPTVYTAHDLKMVCLNYKMMHHGKICEECKGQKYIKCMINKCVKDSTLKSVINMCEGYLHKWHKSYDNIDCIITPSAFYKMKFEEFGIKSDRIIHLQNFLYTEKPEINIKEDSEKYYLYFGRMSEEKGIMTLIQAFENIDAKLYIVGTGPLEEELKRFVQNKKLQNIQLLGFKSGQDLKDIVGNAKAVILPSEWYENGPYSAIEALQLGRPIIGADIGGIAELVVENGMLFESGNAHTLHDCILCFEKTPDSIYCLWKANSERLYQSSYTAQSHYNKLMLIYENVVNEHMFTKK